MLKTTIEITFQVEGWHHWKDAPPSRSYLANDHRHLFHVQASLEVKTEDREVEFHDFMDFCKMHFVGGQMGGKSCEMMARELLDQIIERHKGRSAWVSVFEDGEVGATVTFYPV